MAFTLLGHVRQRARRSRRRCCLSTGISWMRCGSWCSRSCTSSGVRESVANGGLTHELASGSAARHRTRCELPAPTAWPIVLAFGVTLVCRRTGHERSRQRSGGDPGRLRRVGWFRDVLPHEEHGIGAGCRSSPQRVSTSAARGRARRVHAPRPAPGAGCRSRSIRSRRVSKAAWQAAWRWRCWRCCTGL